MSFAITLLAIFLLKILVFLCFRAVFSHLAEIKAIALERNHLQFLDLKDLIHEIMEERKDALGAEKAVESFKTLMKEVGDTKPIKPNSANEIHAENMRKRWKDPKFREKMLAATRKKRRPKEPLVKIKVEGS